jgi:Protein-L-isoaspartate(D-aspartate) O-methyltransferase (PCMT)
VGSSRIVLATSGNRNANIAMAQPAVQLDHLAADRERMVARQIARRGVRDVPREEFVAPGFAEFAYEDGPLPIAERQTISQLAQGKIDIELHGTRLRGGFSLIGPAMQSAAPDAPERWLLIKHRDAYADPAWDIEDPAFDRSVLTGRSMHKIESGRPKEVSRRARARG